MHDYMFSARTHPMFQHGVPKSDPQGTDLSGLALAAPVFQFVAATLLYVLLSLNFSNNLSAEEHDVARWESAMKLFEESDKSSRPERGGTLFIGSAGNPRPELFVEDGLHLSDAGYQVWAELVTTLLN